MCDSEEQRRAILGRSRERQDWAFVVPEFEAKFLGRGTKGKISFIESTPEAWSIPQRNI